jgi:16S rRNA (guanine1516-N2)-methyltransferase
MLQTGFTNKNSWVVVPESSDYLPLATEVAEKIGVPVGEHIPPSGWVLLVQEAGIVLRDPEASFKPIGIDFSSAALTYRRRVGGGKQQAVAKAIGVTSKDKPTVLDATAGLGEDAFVLASLGCQMQLVERHPVVAILLQDAIARAKQSEDEALRAIVSLMACYAGDIRHGGLTQISQPDVVYLDPMFPERKKTALVKKEMRIIKALVGDDPDADELLPVAMEIAKKRVVVKRPTQAPFLMKKKPHHQLLGKANRFDIYQV